MTEKKKKKKKKIYPHGLPPALCSAPPMQRIGAAAMVPSGVPPVRICRSVPDSARATAMARAPSPSEISLILVVLRRFWRCHLSVPVFILTHCHVVAHPTSGFAETFFGDEVVSRRRQSCVR